MESVPLFCEIDPELMRLVGSSDSVLLDPAYAVYTNRNLDLGKITWVGFDMDYTLAVYRRQPMEQLQYDLTIRRLVEHYGYPPEILSLPYNPNLIIRGLVLDKQSGHLLKMDIQGQVWRALYGHQELSAHEIDALYANRKIKVGSAQYPSLDTLFAMPEACLYCNLIEFFQGKPIDSARLFDDVRHAIDLIHSDGSLKSIITQDLPTYIDANSDIALTLHKLRSVGKKLFLLTNSHWGYTNVVMQYLLENRLSEYNTWMSYFDIIIVGSRKPSFFIEHNPFYEVDIQAEHIKETHHVRQQTQDTVFNRAKVYLGGNISDFEKMSGAKGKEILYVGDHIFGDILRSKKDSLWRTCLIVEELSYEIRLFTKYEKDMNEMSHMEATRLSIDNLIGQRRALLAHIDAEIRRHPVDYLFDVARNLRHEIDKAKKFLASLDVQTREFQDKLERRFHPVWGRHFREHDELSVFGGQISSYACIYTSKLTNLLQYSPMHIFRSAGELMCHERTLRFLK